MTAHKAGQVLNVKRCVAERATRHGFAEYAKRPRGS